MIIIILLLIINNNNSNNNSIIYIFKKGVKGMGELKQFFREKKPSRLAPRMSFIVLTSVVKCGGNQWTVLFLGKNRGNTWKTWYFDFF